MRASALESASFCERALKLPPSIEQNKIYTCGPTCVRSVMLAFEKDFSLDDLERWLKTSSVAGTEGREIVNFFRTLGFSSDLRKEMSFAELDLLLENHGFAILNVQSEGEGHWVVVVKTQPKILLMDPWKNTGQYKELTTDQLAAIWYGNEGQRAAITIQELK